MLTGKNFTFIQHKGLFALINNTKMISFDLSNEDNIKSFKYWYLVTSENPY